ncbi:Carboxylesterase patB [Golovinomyces cichoracearum]|uniref:Carboxylic ester hydrolase n=1 Tax=Golovinomyces cichoracearum TaxID=62708 RepID=A0A420IK48_9PEZI|nr:Carboxylesterase patB [Golovinomyces cichoracearum]
MLKYQSLYLLTLIALSLVSALTTSNRAQLNPIIDLQYSLHQGNLDESGKYYSFTNIRYAAAPVGKLRFAAPVAPVVNRTLSDGQQDTICAQATPLWGNIMIKNLVGTSPDQLKKDEEELEALGQSLTIDSISNIQPVDPRTSEDCLFLDVIVPEKIFNQNKSAPVLVWIYGGGYVGGDKTSAGNPEYLLAKAMEDGEGVVYVAMNYRLGLFGWLSGSNFTSQEGVPNVGLYDQRFALEWVQKYIHLFGGDPKRVTVMGESAGGGSIMHHITAWGSKSAPPFQQAILQSPGFMPIAGNVQREVTFLEVISQAKRLINKNITSTSDLRDLDFKTLAALNKIIVSRSTPYGTFTFGPVVDGKYVPKLPGSLMSEGRHAESLSVLIAHNSNEGYLFTTPYIKDAQIDSIIDGLFLHTSSTPSSFSNQSLWPAIYDGTMPYSNPPERASLFISELGFDCLARYTALAYPNSSYAYNFAIPPGYHSFDLPYTFYRGQQGSVNATVAHTMQSIITNFVKHENPNGPGVPNIPKYVPGSQMLVLSNTSIESVRVDSAANDRCTWLQNAPFAT